MKVNLNKNLLILFTGRTSLGELRGKPMMLWLTVVHCMLKVSEESSSQTSSS